MECDWRHNLQKAMDAQGINGRQLSLRLKKNEHYISQLLTRSNTPSIRILTQIADALNVRPSLILDGMGDDPEIDIIAAELAELSTEDLGIVKELVLRLKTRNR